MDSPQELGRVLSPVPGGPSHPVDVAENNRRLRNVFPDIQVRNGELQCLHVENKSTNEVFIPKILRHRDTNNPNAYVDEPVCVLCSREGDIRRADGISDFAIYDINNCSTEEELKSQACAIGNSRNIPEPSRLMYASPDFEHVPKTRTTLAYLAASLILIVVIIVLVYLVIKLKKPTRSRNMSSQSSPRPPPLLSTQV
jgi:hypothetical protein